MLFDEKLKQKMKEEGFKYDFKYIQKEFESDKQTLEYLSYEDLNWEIRHPIN